MSKTFHCGSLVVIYVCSGETHLMQCGSAFDIKIHFLVLYYIDVVLDERIKVSDRHILIYYRGGLCRSMDGWNLNICVRHAAIQGKRGIESVEVGMVGAAIADDRGLNKVK